MVENTLKLLPIGELAESARNPRKRFDAAALADLTQSIKASGILTPLTVRPNGKGYEIGAGHRRFRAAKAAGLTEVPAFVRDMSDEALIELLNVENLQREDLHPLEEADGYQQLLRLPGHDVAKIAAKVGRSVKYVYDRVKLLALSKEAQKLFFEGRITAGHAILLARLKPAEQALALEDGVFTHERLLWNPDRDEDAESDEELTAQKPVSVRELQGWIDEHVKFDPAAADPMLFPETVAFVERAREVVEKIVPITHASFVQPTAKDGSRIWGPRSWKHADLEAETCEYSVTGVIVVGPGRGEAFKVCVAKKKCKVHWGEEQKRRAKGPAAELAWELQRRVYEAKYKAEQARAERVRANWKKAIPEILEALATRVKKMPAKPGGLLGKVLLERNVQPRTSCYLQLHKGGGADDLVRHAVFMKLAGEVDEWYAPQNFPKRAKAFGVDVRKIVDAVAPPEVQTAAEPAEAKKKGGRPKKVKRPNSARRTKR